MIFKTIDPMDEQKIKLEIMAIIIKMILENGMHPTEEISVKEKIKEGMSNVAKHRFNFFAARVQQLALSQQTRNYGSPFNPAFIISLRVYAGRCRAFTRGIDSHLTVGELLEVTRNVDGYSRATINKAIDDLVKQKHIYKINSKKDKRLVLLLPTDKAVARRCAQALMGELLIIASLDKDNARRIAFKKEWLDELEYPINIFNQSVKALEKITWGDLHRT